MIPTKRQFIINLIPIHHLWIFVTSPAIAIPLREYLQRKSKIQLHRNVQHWEVRYSLATMKIYRHCERGVYFLSNYLTDCGTSLIFVCWPERQVDEVNDENYFYEKSSLRPNDNNKSSGLSGSSESHWIFNFRLRWPNWWVGKVGNMLSNPTEAKTPQKLEIFRNFSIGFGRSSRLSLKSLHGPVKRVFFTARMT